MLTTILTQQFLTATSIKLLVVVIRRYRLPRDATGRCATIVLESGGRFKGRPGFLPLFKCTTAEF
jgi:hypothetical protein